MERDAGLRIGTAGWAIPRPLAPYFPSEGTGLQRYAARFGAVEINSTFYRPHRQATFARWRDTTPEGFQFAVKLPRAITHEAKLAGCEARLETFVGEACELGDKLRVLLVQLPPSLAFEAGVAADFFGALREREPERAIACEPRHVSWFEAEADALLAGRRVARAAADPARHPLASAPGGWTGFAYHRLHGSPRMYYSAYGRAALEALAAQVAAGPADETWCMFDNTTSGAAAADALDLAQIMSGGRYP
jgi:uncharacterized protein YecE (DUF72 family)